MIFHISCEIDAPLMLDLKDGTIQCVEPKPLPPFVARYQLVLAENRLASCLAELEIPRLVIESAIVRLAGRGEEVLSHSRLFVGQYFTQDQIRDLPLDGDRLLTMNDEYLFVSESLKRKLQDAGFEYLTFTGGLSAFA